MRDSHGGFELGRPHLRAAATGPRQPRPRRAAAAGASARGGRTSAPAADVVAVRQNLDLVVANGRPVPGVASNANGRWGTAHTQFQYTTALGPRRDRRG